MTSPHPLDPLSADERRRAAAVLRRDRDLRPSWRFASIELQEPDKRAPRDDPPSRRAVAIGWDRAGGDACRAIVSLDEERVVSWEERPGEQANMTVDEWHECDEALRRDRGVLEALARRGIEPDAVLLDVWNYGAQLIPEPHRGRRIGWTDVWIRGAEGANPYANPVNGLHFVVDLNTMELLGVEDEFSVERPEGTMGEYVPALVPGQTLRSDLQALDVVQPEGASFVLDGHALAWQRWSMRLGFNHREGLVIHALGYEDGGRVRPVAHRMSFAEMVVPYRDPSTDHYRRTAFDVGEWGLGFMTTSLELGCDCLGEVAYLDAVLHDSKGEPYPIANAICVHEEDDGVLWKHVDPVAGAEVRRSRRLVVSFHATVANYEYLVYWRFYQDGNVECEVRATGIMVTSQFPPGEQPPYGTLVDQRTYAPTHQHFIVARLDLDVDGEENTVVATESEALPIGPDNPHGLALVQRDTPLRTESEGRQHYEWRTQRAWKVVNPARTNGLGTPVAYKLVPGGAIPAMLDPGSPVIQRAGALQHTLWVTPYDPEERWPCGEFPVQSGQDAGLPAWTARDRPIADADVVLWYVFGIHHVARPEEWPVMPVDRVSFWLKPAGFFDRNPALDVAPSSNGHCHPSPRRPADPRLTAADAMIDPLERWSHIGEKPDYAGLATFGGAPYVLDAAELEGADVAVIGAPMDELVSDRSGSRFAPRAIRAASCPPGAHLEAGVDAFAELRVVDFGDAPVVPADAGRSHAAIEATVATALARGALPVVLGGDHSITEPVVRACAAVHAPVGLVHFDTHTDTGDEVFGVRFSHGTVMRRLVEAGHVDPRRYVQVGLRGYWPGPAEFAWQAERGITSLFMHDVRDLGIREVMARAVRAVGAGPAFLTVDVDVLDPAFAPGTGTPEPGGMTSAELLWAVRTAGAELDLVGADLVEVIPTGVGSADVSALLGDRIVREILTGVAVRRRAAGAEAGRGFARADARVPGPGRPGSAAAR